MNITEIGSLRIFVPKRGVNKDTLGTEYRKGKLEFTKAAVKAHNEEQKKTAIIRIPITNVAFLTNGADATTFSDWIKTLVWDAINSTSSTSYEVEDYHVLRRRLN